MGKILVFAALESEFFSPKSLYHPIIYTGVGKINAAISVTKSILEFSPDLVVNVGTAGSLKKDLVGIHFVSEVIEHDMNAEPLAERGQTPFDKIDPCLKSDIGNKKCATGDAFVTEKDPWLLRQGVDLVDMELFAIAKVCETFGVKWRSMKYVSDYVDENSAINWSDSLKNASIQINHYIEELFK
jgi:adenosylhomocysteine nucleosidase